MNATLSMKNKAAILDSFSVKNKNDFFAFQQSNIRLKEHVREAENRTKGRPIFISAIPVIEKKEMNAVNAKCILGKVLLLDIFNKEESLRYSKARPAVHVLLEGLKACVTE